MQMYGASSEKSKNCHCLTVKFGIMDKVEGYEVKLR